MDVNITTTLYPTETETEIWPVPSEMFQIVGFVVAVCGFGLNSLCYLAANQLPNSSSATLIKHVAIFDSWAAFQDGVLDLGFKILGFDLANINVSLCSGKSAAATLKTSNVSPYYSRSNFFLRSMILSHRKQFNYCNEQQCLYVWSIHYNSEKLNCMGRCLF